MDVGGDMNLLIDFIRKAVILVLLMELVLCLQPGKQFAPYLKMLVGVMITYTLASHMIGIFSGGVGKIERIFKEYEWSSNWSFALEEQAEYETEASLEETENTDIHISLGEVKVDNIKIEEIKIGNVY